MNDRCKTVMVVDDEENLCETLKDLFENEGYNVETASNGRDALTKLKSMITKPCLVILDLIMPILDGNATYRCMQEDPELAGIPVVISTSDPSRAPAGLTVLRKPVALNLLLATIKRSC